MSIKKEYSQDGSECKVTFLLSQNVANDFNSVCVLGDFNNWSPDTTKFSESEADGSYAAVAILSTKGSYQFRYLANGNHWFNEPEADREVESYFNGVKNSVIDI